MISYSELEKSLKEVIDIKQTLEYHSALNPKIWNSNAKMKPEVRTVLMANANAFIAELSPEIKPEMVKDICLTGSNANYNYTQGSDLDLHILIEFPDDIHEEFAQAKKAVWNAQHKTAVYGFPVEVYPQNSDEPIVEGSGWYSIKNRKWLQQPVHQDNVDVNNPHILTTAYKIGKEISFAIKHHVTNMKILHDLGKRIWGLRDQSKHGEFSLNNLAFKELRNAGLTDEFNDYLQEIQNEGLSLSESFIEECNYYNLMEMFDSPPELVNLETVAPEKYHSTKNELESMGYSDIKLKRLKNSPSSFYHTFMTIKNGDGDWEFHHQNSLIKSNQPLNDINTYARKFSMKDMSSVKLGSIAFNFANAKIKNGERVKIIGFDERGLHYYDMAKRLQKRPDSNFELSELHSEEAEHPEGGTGIKHSFIIMPKGNKDANSK